MKEEPTNPLVLIAPIIFAVLIMSFLLYLGYTINESIANEDDETLKEISEGFGSTPFMLVILGVPLIMLVIIGWTLRPKEEVTDEIKYIDTDEIKIELGDVADGVDAYHPGFGGKTL